MKLIVQPDAGLSTTVTAIKHARKTIDVLIFRLDLQEVTRALEAAAARGCRALRSISCDVTEMMIIDRRLLHVYGFNFTGLDIGKNRALLDER